MDRLTAAATLGAITGLRTFSGIAVVCNRLARRPHGDRLGVLAWAAEPGVARATALIAAGELVADKHPALPPRTEPGPLIGRMAFGALAGTLVARAAGETAWPAAIVAAACAAASATAATLTRRRLTHEHSVPDVAVGLAEDGLVAATAAAIWRTLP